MRSVEHHGAVPAGADDTVAVPVVYAGADLEEVGRVLDARPTNTGPEPLLCSQICEQKMITCT